MSTHDRPTDRAASTSSDVHVVLVGTKPDIIKQAPIFSELAARGHDTVLCHTGQHYDSNLSGSMLDGFGISEDVNLGVTGQSSDLTAGIVKKLSGYLEGLRESGREPVLYVHGDTTTAMAGSVAGFSVGAGLVHVEAGLRTLSPRPEVLAEWADRGQSNELDWAEFSTQMRSRESFSRGSREPSPEQFNTRVADAASHVHAVPVELNREFLLEEGFDPTSIDVVGNSVADSVALSSGPDSDAGMLEEYPAIAGGDFIRYCVHRRENTADRKRFMALMEGMEGLLENGRSVLFIRLLGTEAAIDRFGLRPWLHDLVRRYGDAFITSVVWDNYSHVIAAMRRCAAIATDSGSIQEEASILNVPCITLRFGSDRGESLLAGGNFLAPPMNPLIVSNVVDLVVANRESIVWEPVYVPGASSRLVDSVERRIEKDGRLSSSEEWRFGLL